MSWRVDVRESLALANDLFRCWAFVSGRGIGSALEAARLSSDRSAFGTAPRLVNGVFSVD